MKKITCIIIILGVVSICIPGCSPPEPKLPDDIAETIEENFGYALAPTWLPDGYEFSGLAPEKFDSARTFSKMETVLPYAKMNGYDYTDTVALIYPLSDYDQSHLMAMFPELVKPDDAVTDIEINGNPAVLQHGMWTNETLRQIQSLQRPLEPEWDYDKGNSVRFRVAVSENETVGVQLGPLFNECELTDDELIRIAESVVVVD